MSTKSQKAISLKTIKKQSDEIALDKGDRVLIISSMQAEAAIAAALLSRAILQSGKLFHLTFIEPFVTVDEINELRKNFHEFAIIGVGLSIEGTKRFKKGRSYPVFVGSESTTEQFSTISIGAKNCISASVHMLANRITNSDSFGLGLAAAATLVGHYSQFKMKGAAREITTTAQKQGLVEERKGFRLFGANFLPLNETLTYSIRPFLKSFEGRIDFCDKLLEEAEIPFSRFRLPLTSLTNEEAQRLTAELLPRLDSHVIPKVLGQDYLFVGEEENSPVRMISGIRFMAESAWSLGMAGASTSIWIGDRAQTLRSFLDLYFSHSRAVITEFEQVKKTLMNKDIQFSGKFQIVPAGGIRKELHADLARLSLEEGTVESDAVLFVNDKGITLSWREKKVNAAEVSIKLRQIGLKPRMLSETSSHVEIASTEIRDATLKMLENL
ncbi:MAG: hypothetical protein ACFE7R_03430 [Candidatus Hodarchaeota archaeon]